jgi:phage shock protein PspC (stress-responsive transcriptional regulator)
MIGGVCGGLGEYFNIDANLVRLFFVVLAFFGGFSVFVYLASLVIIPINPEQTAPKTGESIIKDKPFFWGSLLIVVGLFILFRQLGIFHAFQFWNIPWVSLWAIVLIILGVVLFLNKKGQEDAAGGEVHEGKKLYRSSGQKMIGGVCGGLAEYFEFDVSAIRILWVIGTLLSAGMGVLIYLIMLIVFPENPNDIKDKKVTS